MTTTPATHRLIKGRQDYACDVCGHVIPQGEPHVAITVFPAWGDDTDRPWTYRAHPACDALWARYGAEYSDGEWTLPLGAPEWREFLHEKGEDADAHA